MVNDMFNGMFGKVATGMCKLTTSGRIAVKCGDTYKSYNVKTGSLTNCANFVFNFGEEFFFVIPTNKVEVGDIILVNKKPRFVKEVGKNQITVVNYEDSTVDTIIPERHMFMGNTYFYGKIVSMFGDSLKGKNGANNMMKYMMMSEMMKGWSGNGNYGNHGNNGAQHKTEQCSQYRNNERCFQSFKNTVHIFLCIEQLDNFCNKIHIYLMYLYIHFYFQ